MAAHLAATAVLWGRVLNVVMQAFKTVSAAIGSHPGHMEVKMEFQRCGQQA
jgi:hypothetical protein